MATVVVDGGPVWLLLLMLLLQFGLTVGFIIWWAYVMSRALNACSRANRKMEPGLAWLILIPGFGLIWQFIAVTRTAESLAQEYYERGWKSDEGRPGIEIGMITASLLIVVLLIRFIIIDLNPGISFFMTLAICICIYMHRERLNAFTERLEKSNRETPMFFVFEQYNNPFALHYQQQQFHQQPQPPRHHAPGWDGRTIWTPPPGWNEPDMDDPRPWF